MNTRIRNLYNQEQETDKLTNLKRKDMMHQMPKLPYEMEALAPLMSKETFDFQTAESTTMRLKPGITPSSSSY